MRFRTTLLFFICLSVLSCSRLQPASTSKDQPFPAGAPMADSIRFTYSVYLQHGRHCRQALKLSTQQLLTKYKTLKVIEDIPRAGNYLETPLLSVHLEGNVPKNYAPPDF